MPKPAKVMKAVKMWAVLTKCGAVITVEVTRNDARCMMEPGRGERIARVLVTEVKDGK